MKTFDYEQVNAVLAPLKQRFDDCAHGEGNECETIDKSMKCCADICFKAMAALKKWARDVFTGEVVFDPEAERLWRTEVGQIYSQAVQIWQRGYKAEVDCWEFTAQGMLAAVLWEMYRLLENWTSPKLSVGPSARVRLKLGENERAAIQKQLSSLPPLAVRNGEKR